MRQFTHRYWRFLMLLALWTGNPATAQTTCDSIGPDVIIGEINAIANYSSSAAVEAFAIGFVHCNIGDAPLATNATSNQHQITAQNLYRLMQVDGTWRLEQIGMGWLHHGFFSLSTQVCCSSCQPAADGSFLGQKCSSPESAAFVGQQSGLRPRYLINASTAQFPWPQNNLAGFSTSTDRRLQAHIADLDPASNPGAQYWVETVCLAPDDATASNAINGASHRKVMISGSGESWTMAIAAGSTTQRELPALHAWLAADANVLLTAVDVPGDGRFILGSKATQLPSGLWRYEYALMNFNSDRSARAFSVPVPSSATISNAGFHDVDYHSGDGLNNVNFDGTDWPALVSSSDIAWSTQSFDENPSANALRWATLYNFRFDADTAPASRPMQTTIHLFKPGSPASVTISAVAPQPLQPCPADINFSGGVDVSDLLMVINAWGDCPAPPAPCPADIITNESIDVSDLLAVINAWGVCP